MKDNALEKMTTKEKEDLIAEVAELTLKGVLLREDMVKIMAICKNANNRQTDTQD